MAPTHSRSDSFPESRLSARTAEDFFLAGGQRLRVIRDGVQPAADALAGETQLLELAAEGVWAFRRWSSTVAVVMGRFQREEYEVVPVELARRGAPLLRRMTGGGTVWQDPGVLNLSFARPRSQAFHSRLVHDECRYLTDLIRQALEESGPRFRQDERNALFHGENKVLGSAAGLIDRAFLYHASLLVCADLDALAACLLADPQYPDRGAFVASRRSPVINLAELGIHRMEDIAEAVLRRFLAGQERTGNP